MRHSIILATLPVWTFYFCCKNNQKEDIPVGDYSSYNATVLPASIHPTGDDSKYDRIIKNSEVLLGLANLDIEIVTTNDFGAFSVINRLSNRRFFVYSERFFDSVLAVTRTDLSIKSICFHEFAHQFHRHPLKPIAASHIYEKQADHFSGYQMRILGATLGTALSAMAYFGNENETPSHPAKQIRLAEIQRGYMDAERLLFKGVPVKINEPTLDSMLINPTIMMLDTTGITVDSLIISYHPIIEKNQMPQVIEYLNFNKDVAVYIVYGELIYFTAKKEIRLVSNDKFVGKLSETDTKKGMQLMKMDGGVTFQFSNEGIIYSEYPGGVLVEAGRKIN